MALGENPPNLSAKAECVRQDLKYEIAVRRTEAMIAKRGQAKGVRRVIDEIESAFERISAVAGVLQSRKTCPLQSLELACIRGLGGQGFCADKSLKCRGHVPIR